MPQSTTTPAKKKATKKPRRGRSPRAVARTKRNAIDAETAVNTDVPTTDKAIPLSLKKRYKQLSPTTVQSTEDGTIRAASTIQKMATAMDVRDKLRPPKKKKKTK